MELQWPLIVFTTLVAWSAGLFGAQALMAARGQAKKSQAAAWAVACALLVVGGVAVFFHLEHWDRIFNGFGNPTSGITQELVAVVVLAVVAVAYLLVMRRSDDGATVPAPLAYALLVVAAATAAVVAHSYVMASRPAWDTVLWVLYVLGNACALGTLTMAALMALRGDDVAPAGLPALAGCAFALVAAVGFAASVQMAGGAFVDVGYHFDPTDPTAALAGAQAAIAAQAPLVWVGGVLVGAAAPLALAFLARRGGEPGSWKAFGAVGAALAAVGAVCMRMAFYGVGLSVFMFY